MGRTGSIDFAAFERLYHSIVNVKTVRNLQCGDSRIFYAVCLYRLVIAFTTTPPINRVLILHKSNSFCRMSKRRVVGLDTN